MRPSPARSRAEAFLAGCIKRPGRAGRRLPTIASLAARAGVAYVTMWKAACRLREQGVLAARPGRGLTLLSAPGSGPVPADTPRPRERRAPWGQVRTAISSDIMAGAIGSAGRLPSVKELAGRYGVCGRTARRALRTLARDNVVVARRRVYHVADLGNPAHRTTIVLIAGEYHAEPFSGKLQMFVPRTAEYLRTLEDECAQRGMRVAVFPYVYDARRLNIPADWKRVFSDRRVLEPVAGFIVWPLGFDPAALLEMLDRLLGLGRPVGLLDEGGDWEGIAAARARPLLQVYNIAHSPGAGTAIGNHLLSLGHRRVVYLCPAFRARWTRNRYLGLRHAFEAAGVSDAVVPVVADSDSETGDISTAVTREAEAQFRGMLRTLPDPASLPGRVLQSLYPAIRELTAPLMTEDRVRRLADRALDEHRATAWVADRDATAVQCLAYLAERRRRVPADISLASFDDSSDAFVRRLTSYNFNGPAVIRAMVHHALWGAQRRGAGSGAIELAGFVNARDTTGRPPGH